MILISIIININIKSINIISLWCGQNLKWFSYIFWNSFRPKWNCWVECLFVCFCFSYCFNHLCLHSCVHYRLNEWTNSRSCFGRRKAISTLNTPNLPDALSINSVRSSTYKLLFKQHVHCGETHEKQNMLRQNNTMRMFCFVLGLKVMFTAVADQGGNYGPFDADRTLVFNTAITNIGDGYDSTSGKYITLTYVMCRGVKKYMSLKRQFNYSSPTTFIFPRWFK